MSETYNPETEAIARLEALEVEARQLVAKRDACQRPQEREVLDRQVREIKERITNLKRKLRP